MRSDPLLILTICSLAAAQFVIPSSAADGSGVYRMSNQTTHSTQLGVDTIPTCVVVNNVRHMGIYIAGAPMTELGRTMKLSAGMVLLTVDGYSMTSGTIADGWLGHRASHKPLVFTYAMALDGQPGIRTGEIQPPAAAVKPSRSSALAVSPHHDISRADLIALCISLINESRRSGGLGPVQESAALSGFGSDYAEYMAKNRDKYEMSNPHPHMDLNGRTPWERAKLAGLNNFLNECIGRSSRGLGDMQHIRILHKQMMTETSGGHREIIMDPEAHFVGVGIAVGPNRLYVTEEFGQ
jgi:uncharacterized protein YkwD